MVSGASPKVMSVEGMAAFAHALQAAGKRVAFTNGCFDLLHVGHVRSLTAARALGDCLVVAINSDHSVHELKGPGRPISSAPERAEVLAALAVVDAVCVFDAPTPLAVIEAVRPDILVKGGDWPVERIVGRELVEAWGGRVCSIPLVEGVSTREILRRIREGG